MMAETTNAAPICSPSGKSQVHLYPLAALVSEDPERELVHDDPIAQNDG